MARHVSIEGIKIPKKHARDRTWNRWIDPMNRERRYGEHDRKHLWQEASNPMCSIGRNEDRFLKRSLVIKNLL